MNSDEISFGSSVYIGGLRSFGESDIISTFRSEFPFTATTPDSSSATPWVILKAKEDKKMKQHPGDKIVKGKTYVTIATPDNKKVWMMDPSGYVKLVDRAVADASPAASSSMRFLAKHGGKLDGVAMLDGDYIKIKMVVASDCLTPTSKGLVWDVKRIGGEAKKNYAQWLYGMVVTQQQQQQQ